MLAAIFGREAVHAGAVLPENDESVILGGPSFGDVLWACCFGGGLAEAHEVCFVAALDPRHGESCAEVAFADLQEFLDLVELLRKASQLHLRTEAALADGRARLGDVRSR